MKPKVWLKSGAFLIIEHTEAMTVIDVNSGRFIGKKSHEQNIMNKTSMKAILMKKSHERIPMKNKLSYFSWLNNNSHVFLIE